MVSAPSERALWLPQDTELLDLRETIDFLKKKNSEAQAVIQGALNGTDVTPKGKEGMVLHPPNHRDATLPELLAQTQLVCSCPGLAQSPRAHLTHIRCSPGQRGPPGSSSSPPGTPEHLKPGSDSQGCHCRRSWGWCLGVMGWLSSRGHLLTGPFADSRVLAAELGFVPMSAVSSPQTPM